MPTRADQTEFWFYFIIGLCLHVQTENWRLNKDDGGYIKKSITKKVNNIATVHYKLIKCILSNTAFECNTKLKQFHICITMETKLKRLTSQQSVLAISILFNALEKNLIGQLKTLNNQGEHI